MSYTAPCHHDVNDILCFLTVQRKGNVCVFINEICGGPKLLYFATKRVVTYFGACENEILLSFLLVLHSRKYNNTIKNADKLLIKVHHNNPALPCPSFIFIFKVFNGLTHPFFYRKKQFLWYLSSIKPRFCNEGGDLPFPTDLYILLSSW